MKPSTSFSPTVEVQMAFCPNRILPKRRAGECRQSDFQHVGEGLQRSQYLRDLDQVADDEACFFCRMGELIAARSGSAS